MHWDGVLVGWTDTTGFDPEGKQLALRVLDATGCGLVLQKERRIDRYIKEIGLYIMVYA